MPELPEMQALSERLDAALVPGTLSGAEVLGFSGLKTVRPAPADVVGAELERVGRRGKFLVLELSGGVRVLFHLSQAGRLDLERPPKKTKPRGSVARLVVTGGAGEVGVLVREHGTQRKAGWWILGPGDDGPLATLGPEPFDEAFAEFLVHGDDNRHLHTILRDQHTVAGIGRGYADDTLNRAGLSPFASLRSLDPGERERLVETVRAVLTEATAGERERTGGLSEAKLGGRFSVHGRHGQPCPRCGATLQRVSYESHEVVYCPACQTNGRTLADRRLSRLLR